MKSIKNAEEVGELHRSARRGVITLIPKKSKDPLLIKNWRPLNMLTTDYKILATVLSTRLKRVLPDIISESQTGFMKGRQISTTLRTTVEVIRNNSKVSGFLLSLDFEKCFDHIEYSAITGSLAYFNIGPHFVKQSELLLKGFTSCTMVLHQASWMYPDPVIKGAQ